MGWRVEAENSDYTHVIQWTIGSNISYILWRMISVSRNSFSSCFVDTANPHYPILRDLGNRSTLWNWTHASPKVEAVAARTKTQKNQTAIKIHPICGPLLRHEWPDNAPNRLHEDLIVLTISKYVKSIVEWIILCCTTGYLNCKPHHN